jgi:tetratricopeptide (TPR) repeat protein
MRSWLSLALAVSFLSIIGKLQAQSSVATSGQTTAQVQTSLGPPDESARPMFEMGRRAYEEGRYAEALDAFQRVFVLTGHPAMLINIANAHARLGEPRRAAASLEQYLALVPDAPDRLVLEDRIRALYDQADSVPLVEAPPAAPEPAAGPPPGAASTPIAPVTVPASVESHGLFMGRTYTWVALGTSLVLAGVGTAVWIDANQRFERLALTCGSRGGCTDRQLEPITNGVTATNVLLIGSAISLLATGFLFAIEGRGSTSERPVRAGLAVDPQGLAVGVSGRM